MAGDVVGGQTRPHTLSPSALDAAAADADTAPTYRALLTGRAPGLPAAAPCEGLRGPVRGFGVGRVRVLRAFLLSGGALTRLGESSSVPALARSPCTSPLPGGIVHAVRADAPGRGFVVVLAAGARPSLVAVAVRILVPALAILFASVLRAGAGCTPTRRCRWESPRAGSRRESGHRLAPRPRRRTGECRPIREIVT